MTPLGIHHVNVTVGDLAEAKAFYVDTLGMGIRGDRPDFGFDGFWLDIGAQQVHLVVGQPPAETNDHFAVRVADLKGTITELRSRGARVSDAIGVGTGHQAFLRDPWGNLIELHQPGASGAAHT